MLWGISPRMYVILPCSGFTQSSPLFPAECDPLWVLFFQPFLSNPTPHESPWYPDPLTNLLSLPSLLLPSLSLFSSTSSSSVAVGGGSPLPAHCYQTMSAFIRPRQHTHTHRRAHTHTNTFEGFPRVKHRGISSLRSPLIGKMICLLASQSVTRCAGFQVHQILQANALQLC